MLSHVQLFVTPWTAACQDLCPSPIPRAYSNSCPLSQWCHPTISSSVVPFSSWLQSFPEAGSFPMIRLFSPKWLSFHFSISSSNEYSWMISFRIELVWSPCCPRDSQNLLQHHSSKASILWHPAFFMVQLSHLYMTAGKTIALTMQTFFGKALSLLFNMLSKFVIALLPKSKHLLISWQQPPSAMILQPRKTKSVTISIVSPSICHEVAELGKRQNGKD